MKRFKEFLAEDITTATTGDTTASKAESGPYPYMVPGSTPTLPGGWPYKPQDKPQDDSNDNEEQEKPTIIDWQELDDRIQEAIEEAERFAEMIRTLGWDAFVAWFFRTYGIAINDTGQWIDGILFNITEELWDWFRENYPNPSENQGNTFIQRMRQLDDRFFDIIINAQPGSPGTPLGGADDPRYQPIDLQDPFTWDNIDYFNRDFYRGPIPPGRLPDPRLRPWWTPYDHDPSTPYPGTYQA